MGLSSIRSGTFLILPQVRVLTHDRLQVTVAKIQQSLPEMKRDGNTVLVSTWHDLIYDESSTERANGVLRQIQFIPTLAKLLQESPDEVIADLEEIRKYSKHAIVGQAYVLMATFSD